MKKKMLFVMATIAAFALFVPSVMAATTEVATDLPKAVNDAASGDTLKLTADIELTADLLINKVLTLDLNGFDITLKTAGKVIKVQGGNLTVTGEGTIKEEEAYYAPLMVLGSDDQSKTNYTVLTVGEKVTLEGWAGVFVRQTANNRGYGVNVTVNGTIKTYPDADDVLGSGVYVNGSIQPKTGESLENYPVITLGKTANIESVGVGIYAAGYATWNINGATITGVEAGLAIKAGKFNITDGTIKSTGEDLRPTEGYNNGVNPSGAAIQVESNKGYAGNIELNIEGGNFVSENGIAVYEYLSKGKEEDTTDDTTVTSIKNIDISGGNFQSEMGDFDVSESFDKKHSEFVSGGTFSDGYVADEYLASDKEYVVTNEGEVLLAENAVSLDIYFVVDGELVKDDEDKVVAASTLFKKGYTFTEEEIKELEEELKTIEEDLNETFKEDGFVFLGLFTDKEGKNKVDFTEALDEDTEWYIVVGEKVEESETPEEPEKVEELPPKTSDINLALLIGTIMLGVVGTVLVSKKRFSKNH